MAQHTEPQLGPQTGPIDHITGAPATGRIAVPTGPGDRRASFSSC